MPFDKKGMTPKFGEGFMRRTDAENAQVNQPAGTTKQRQDSTGYPARKMVEGMEKYGGSKPNFKSGMGKK